MSEWTRYEDLVITSGASEGASYAEVAAKLGRTRNMIAGRAHRLGVKFKCDHLPDIISRNMLRRWKSHKLWCSIDPNAPRSLVNRGAAIR